MAWLSIGIETDCTHAEALADALLEAGALSAIIEDADAGTAAETPQFGEPGSVTTPGWERSRVVALLAAEADADALVAACAVAAGLDDVPLFTRDTVAEQNWVQLTQAQFEPIRVSGRLWIVPSWHEAPDPDAIVLVLDPGMAFGTGSHPTTRLCLEWLESATSDGVSILDYGCGSGILAIAGAKLGAADVRGILRRGATAGYAEVDFESDDRRRYRARWSVRRARGKSDGALQGQELGLTALDTGEVLGGKKTETLVAIRQRLGLSFDQFRRSVLLA